MGSRWTLERCYRAVSPVFVGPAGLEPATYGLEVNPLHTLYSMSSLLYSGGSGPGPDTEPGAFMDSKWTPGKVDRTRRRGRVAVAASGKFRLRIVTVRVYAHCKSPLVMR